MKKLPSNVAHNRPKFFFSIAPSCPYGQKMKIHIEMCLKTHLFSNLWSDAYFTISKITYFTGGLPAVLRNQPNSKSHFCDPRD